ncbi:hypothetical protein Goshw_004054, partial [Gossypium schwendimanii]|nr:hypothetical protein [Gossypium schwendimanii]
LLNRELVIEKRFLDKVEDALPSEYVKEFVATPRRDNILEENWMAILQSFQDEDIEWRASWMIPDEILYRCGDFDWYRSRQFVPTTQGLAQCKFAYKGDNYKKKVREISNAWNQSHKMKIFSANSMTTPEYDWWWGKRVNENVPALGQENTRPIVEHLQVVLSELEIINLKIDYKKLCLSIKTAGLGKTSKQWDLLESQNEKVRLRARVAELERLLHKYRIRNSLIELKASINRIEELKRMIEELEIALQNCELRVELLETNNEHWKEQIQCAQDQIRDRDHIMGEVVTQVREVADHLQTLAIQADMLSLKYELELDRG